MLNPKGIQAKNQLGGWRGGGEGSIGCLAKIKLREGLRDFRNAKKENQRERAAVWNMADISSSGYGGADHVRTHTCTPMTPLFTFVRQKVV